MSQRTANDPGNTSAALAVARWAAFRRFAAAIVLVAFAGGTVEGCGAVAHEAPQPAILFTRCCEEIWLLRSNGSTQFIAAGDNPEWMPGHQELIFRRTNDNAQPGPQTSVWIVNFNGTGLREVMSVASPNQVRFMATGGHPVLIAYDDQDGIWTMSIDGSRKRELLRDKGNANELAISPDGSTIAYAFNGDRGLPPALDLVGTNGRRQRVAFQGTQHTCGVRYPSWSPDGYWIAFSLCTEKGEGGEDGIWLVRRDGKDLHRIAASGISPTWSPDGKWIAFSYVRQSNEMVALVKVHPDGSGLVPLAPYMTGKAVTLDETPDW